GTLMIGSAWITCGDPKSKPASALPFFLATRALEFTILTANGRRRVARANTPEFRYMRWRTDIAERQCTIATDRMMGGREHRVRLSAPAVAIVKTVIEIR